MDKILETYKDIVVSTRKLKIRNYSITVIAIAILLISAFTIYSIHMSSLNNMVILDYDGHVRNPKVVSPEEGKIIKAQAFIEDWLDHMFTYDPTNIHERLEYAVELGDNSVKDLYKNFKARNWYNDIVANNLRQDYYFVTEPVVEESGGFYTVYCECKLTLQDMAGQSEVLEYGFDFTCYLVPIAQSFPKFKQGLFINNLEFNLTEY
jgi:hypothetical protein